MNRDLWLKVRRTPRHPQRLRYLHVSTRYVVRVKSAAPFLFDFVRLTRSGEPLPRRWSDTVKPGNFAPGSTYRRVMPKGELRRPGARRRLHLASMRAEMAEKPSLARRIVRKLVA